MGPYRELYVDAEDAIGKDNAVPVGTLDMTGLAVLMAELYSPIVEYPLWCFPGCYVTGCESTDCRRHRNMVLIWRAMRIDP